jgi:hypothetical protein
MYPEIRYVKVPTHSLTILCHIIKPSALGIRLVIEAVSASML